MLNHFDSIATVVNNEEKTCLKCLYTTAHPLGLVIDDSGICSGCRVHEEKDMLDWNERWDELERFIKPYKSHSGNYDCIVPVSGGQDSYYIMHLVKKLKLNPLLVTYNKYYNTPLGIRNLANLRVRHNCDLLTQNVNPCAVRNITRTTLRRLGSVYWHCIAGQTAFPVQTAIRYKIPLIIWGAQQGLEQVGMYSHLNNVQMTRRYRKEHDLMGYEADDLISTFDSLKEEDIWQYRYPDDSLIHDIGVTGIYLGNYVRWDPKAQHELMIKHYNYQTAAFSRTFDCYDYVDCFNYMGIHDLLKYYKCGFSKVTDHACREIRHNRITRAEGNLYVNRYENNMGNYTKLFADWIGIPLSSLNYLLNNHRNPRFWQEESPEQWVLRRSSTMIESETLDSFHGFIASSALDERKKPGYIVMGKGYPYEVDHEHDAPL